MVTEYWLIQIYSMTMLIPFRYYYAKALCDIKPNDGLERVVKRMK
jgi:hypothetical protein